MMTEEKQEQAPAKEESDFALLDALVEKHGDGSPEPGPSSDDPEPVAEAPKQGAVRDEKGQFAPKAAEEEGGDAEKAEAAPEKETTAGKPEEYERALAALRRDKTPQATIEAMEPEALTAWGLSVAERQSKTDREWAAQKQKLEELEAAQKGKAEDPRGQPSADDAALAETLQDYLDEDGAQALVQLVERASGKAKEDALSELGPLKALVENLLLDNTLRGLEATWPQLSDTEQRKAVREKMTVLNPEHYDSIESLAGDAARIVFFNQADGASGQIDLDRQKNNGRTRTTQKRGKPRALTQAEKDFALLDRLTKQHNVPTPE